MNRIFQVILLLSLPIPLHADLLRLTNGNTLEGVVLSETPEQVELQFAAGGSITFHREEIVSIETADAASRDDLRGRWAADQARFQDEMKEQKAFEAAQRSKGLMRDGGEWIPREEYAERTKREELDLQARKIESDRAAAKEVAAAVTLAAQPAPKTEALDLSKPIAPGIVVSYPFWDWRGQPVYKTFPVVNNRPPHRRQHEDNDKGKEKRPERPLTSPYTQATSRVFNQLFATSRGALAP